MEKALLVEQGLLDVKLLFVVTSAERMTPLPS